MVTVGKRGDEAAVRELLRKNAAALFAARDKHGQSVLHTAAFAGHAGGGEAAGAAQEVPGRHGAAVRQERLDAAARGGVDWRAGRSATS
jgi:ankyrin repeat protein